jgi:hypothetical protein
MNQTDLPGGYPSQPKTCGLAIWSLVLGILSLSCLTVFCGIPGVICGHKALARIKYSGGTLGGQGLAIAGLVTGYLGILWGLLVIPLLVAIAIPNFVKARDMSMQNACVNNLRVIDAAKNQWALETGKTNGAVPTEQDLKPYFKNHVFPICPAGGIYTIGRVGGDPMCSIPAHTLSQVGGGHVANEPAPSINTVTVRVTTTQQPATPQATAGFHAAAVPAEGTFIPAPYRTDMVHDPKRNLLYISAGDSILRYQLASNSFLPPLNLRGDLRGIDLSPDNDLLAVADAANTTGNIGIHLVDLKSEADLHVTFPAERSEGGTYSVAFGADGAVWITSSFQGSGDVPLRKYSPATRKVMVAARVGQDTMLTASANHEYIGYAEANSSAGNYGRFRCESAHPLPPLRANAFLYEIGVSRDGSQLAVPTYGKMVLSGAAMQQLDEKETLDAVYHPLRDFIFLTRANISTIAVYETTNYTKVKDLDFGERFEWPGQHAFQSGRLRLSSDGKFVFCTVQGGVRYAETGL